MFASSNKCICFFVGNCTNFEDIVQKFTKAFKNYSEYPDQYIAIGLYRELLITWHIFLLSRLTHMLR